MKLLLILLLAATASLGGFVVHVTTVEWLPNWIGTQMNETQIQPSWDVRYIAAVTSIEYGLAAVGLYYLSREKLLAYGKLKAAAILSLLLIAINGVLIRQPLMDYIIGNPLHVTLVQNGFKWLPWILMSFIVVFGYEFINKLMNNHYRNSQTK